MHDTLKLHQSSMYFQSQKDICFNCDLFSDKNTNGSKIIMLFAEIFSFLVDTYGLNNISKLIVQYSNTNIFKQWFWRQKHSLGEYLNTDPSFDDIGKWIGRGFFLKISLSLIIYHNLLIDSNLINRLVTRQKKLIKELSDDYMYKKVGNNFLNLYDDYYFLFDEKNIISNDHEYFYLENIIK